MASLPGLPGTKGSEKMDHRRNRRQMKLDQEQHYDEMESHKASDNAVEAFKRPAYQEYSVKQCLRKWGVDLSGNIDGQAKTKKA